ncbi:AraC family transcriptional regulator [Flammeovirga aprica]|uniref:Helix-turn-helix transcriptional regulator n=1 Tax=Flammeovirga aprica JL-4 TaxID=694437 RepID=A0A7X9NZK2_9BACT|nr:AraC family transcriptional regulator [Flammeovirga aprica]NME66685.1 helix-turn-helix transcriptional regulator [Flammeovirga aprica JL-4]
MIKNKTNILLDSTTIDSLYASIHQNIGGERVGNRIIGNTILGNVNLESFNHIQDFNISINHMTLNKTAHIYNNADNSEGNVYMLVVKGDGTVLANTGERKLKEVKKNELIVYSNINKVILEFPMNQSLSLVGLRLNREQLISLLNHSEDAYQEMITYLNENVLIDQITSETLHIIEEIIKIQNSTVIGRSSIIIGKGLELAGRFLTQVYHKIHNQRSNINHISQEEMELYHEIKDYLLQDYENIPTISSVAKEFGIGETKLKERFKSIFGKPIFKFITTHRMLDAHRLIEMTDTPISRVAKEIGYPHLSKFSMVFKKHYGYTPSELRKNTVINAY